jgi:hypothetical protein
LIDVPVLTIGGRAGVAVHGGGTVHICVVHMIGRIVVLWEVCLKRGHGLV